MSHDDKYHYRDYESAYAGGGIQPQPAADQQSFSVTAACPECHGTFNKTVPRGLPYGNKGLFSDKARPEPKIPDHIIVVCACGYTHPGRPADSTESGCGAVWKQPLA